MKRWITVILIGVVAGSVYAATNIDDQEETIGLKQLPEPVKKAVLRVSKNTTIGEIVKEIEDGKTVYEVEMVIDKVEIEVEFDGKGNILDLEIERQGDDDDDDDEEDHDEPDDDDDPDEEDDD